MSPPRSSSFSDSPAEAPNVCEYIIYEDARIVAFNKPEGLLSIPDGFDPAKPNLRDLAAKLYGNIWVLHRLDKNTSGVIVFAKDATTHKAVNLAFTNREIHKTYVGIVFGSPFWDEKCIDYPIQVNGDRNHRTVYDPIHGKKATTEVQVIFKNKGFSRLDIHPRSGYTHQIRAHLSIVGHPIVGDALYNRLRLRSEENKIMQPLHAQGQFLHAQSISFPTRLLKGLQISAPLPRKYGQFL